MRKNTNFTINGIAQGDYIIRVFYGNHWNSSLENPCGTHGYFEYDVSFSEFDEEFYFEDSEDGYTVGTITLHAVTGGNARSSKISETDFFAK